MGRTEEGVVSQVCNLTCPGPHTGEALHAGTFELLAETHMGACEQLGTCSMAEHTQSAIGMDQLGQASVHCALVWWPPSPPHNSLTFPLSAFAMLSTLEAASLATSWGVAAASSCLLLELLLCWPVDALM